MDFDFSGWAYPLLHQGLEADGVKFSCTVLVILAVLKKNLTKPLPLEMSDFETFKGTQATCQTHWGCVDSSEGSLCEHAAKISKSVASSTRKDPPTYTATAVQLVQTYVKLEVGSWLNQKPRRW